MTGDYKRLYSEEVEKNKDLQAIIDALYREALILTETIINLQKELVRRN